MQHSKLGRRFGRQSAHRQAMFSNMAASLIRHEQIVTTLAKAKDLRRVMDKYITLAKRGDLNSRRLAASRMRDEAMVKKLFDTLGPRYKDRSGGYTRVLKAGYRYGNSAPVAVIELVDRDETRQGRRGQGPLRSHEGAAKPPPAREAAEAGVTRQPRGHRRTRCRNRGQLGQTWRSAAAVAAAGFVLHAIAPALAQRKEPPPSREAAQYSFAPIVKKAAPAVVNVYVRARVATFVSPFADDPLFRRFFGERFGTPQERIQNSLGSGVIISADGIVVTNTHVVKVGGAAEIRIALADRREFDAKVIQLDEKSDIAVLRIEGGDGRFPYLEFENSDSIEVGDQVLAIGNPFGVGQTVTSGIISALARTEVGQSDTQCSSRRMRRSIPATPAAP